MRITTDTNELVDIRAVQVDRALPQSERINDFRKQIKDPNHYRCGGIKVNAKYADNGKSIEDCLRPCVS
jgi:hypothetical protein